jgi:hypothetical protein
MIGSFCGRIELRQRQMRIVVIAVEMLGRSGQRVMRRHERDEQNPRFAAAFLALLVQPDLRARGDVAVVERVRRLARSAESGHLVSGASHRQIVANEAEKIAFAFDDVHRHDRLREAAILVLRAEMQFSDRDDAMAGVTQVMMPARDRAVIRIGIVPKSDLMNVLAGRERGARRDAHGRRRPTGCETRSPRRQPVEIRRMHERMAVAAHHVAAVLIRHDDQQVLRLHIAAPDRCGRPRLPYATVAGARPLRRR